MGTNRATVVKVSAAAIALSLGLVGCVASPSGSGPSPSPSASSTQAPAASRIVISGKGLAVESSDGALLSSIAFTADVTAARASLSTVIGSEPTLTHVPEDNCSFEHDKYDWHGLSLIPLANGPYLGDRTFSVEITAPKVGRSVSLESSDGTTVGMSADKLKASSGAIPGQGEGNPYFTYDATPVADEVGVFWGALVGVNVDGTVKSFLAPSLTPDYC
jgi:hypothetical protein